MAWAKVATAISLAKFCVLEPIRTMTVTEFVLLAWVTVTRVLLPPASHGNCQYSLICLVRGMYLYNYQTTHAKMGLGVGVGIRMGQAKWLRIFLLRVRYAFKMQNEIS